MKIKTSEKSYNEVMAIERKKHEKPKNPSMLFKLLLKLVALPDLAKADFKYEKVGMERLGKKEPALYLMNHSSFIDLEIVVSMLFPRSFNIVTTSDAFIGKDRLMRLIGCIPTNKFTPDTALVRDVMHAVRKNGSSIVLFPEASYSFDGTATPLPDTTAKLVKLLGIPLVMIRTYGAFSRDPLYNDLQIRDVKVSAKETYLLSPEQIKEMSVEEIEEIINKEFSFDNFSWQKENKIRISEPFRADKLNRVLYKCPKCLHEGCTVGEGVRLVCKACGASYVLDEYGYMKAEVGETEFDHIPDWYQWERECVRDEIKRGEYSLDLPVEIRMAVDTHGLYHVGEGRLRHDIDGFVLDGCQGELHFEYKPLCSHSLYSDFNWYEVGDVICIGNADKMFYCFPKTQEDVVAKARLATEEIYKIRRQDRSAECHCH